MANLLHQLVERLGHDTQSAAVLFPGGSWSYAELNRRADQVAALLRQKRVAKETIVGVFFDRDPLWIASAVGALKAGCAFAALDEGLSDQRVAALLAICKAPVTLTKEAMVARLAGAPGEAVAVDLASDQPGTPYGPSGDHSSLGLTPRSAGCVVFTSGSSGTPKAALHEHRGLVHQAHCHRQGKYVESSSRVLQFSPLTSANTVAEVFMTLAAGACVVTLPRRSIAPGPDLIDAVRQYDITHLHVTPSVLAVTPVADAPSLQTLSVGGEPVDPAVVDPWADRYRVVQCFGTTETFWLAMTEFQRGVVPPPIGRPLEGVRAMLLGQDGQPAASGQPGELYIGGICLARGYLDASLNAEKFVEIAGERWYRSGDRARFLEDGRIQILGRVDRQVQIRGNRVEPAEVESVLSQHPGVADCVVALKAAPGGQPRLTAYLVARDDQSTLTMSSVREFLVPRLPAAAIPEAIVLLDTIPLNLHNKVDFDRLPEPPGDRPGLDGEFVAPRSETERVIAKIWEELLDVSPVGVHDDLLELGGHSLTAVRIAFQIEMKLGVRIAAADLFDRSSVGSLAAWVDEMRRAEEPVEPRMDDDATRNHKAAV